MLENISIKQIIKRSEELVGQNLEVRAWVRSRRDSKAGISFIALSDGSCFDTLQVVAENKLVNYESEIQKLTKDCSIIVKGKIVASLGGKQSVELLAHEIKVMGFVESPDTYPISPKRHTVEYLRDYCHLRVRTNLISSVMRVRNTIAFAIHEFLQKNGYFWIHTPIITTSDAEGAGEMFRVTSLDLNNLPRSESGAIDYRQDFFSKETFLTVSGQLHLESYALGMSKVYTFGPSFRAENSNTTRHLAEFWMIELEVAFMNLMQMAAEGEALLKYVFKSVLERNADDMEFFAKFVDKDVINRLQDIVDSDFKILTYTNAVDKLMQANVKFENPVSWGIDLSSEHEKWLCEKYVGGPTIITDYPAQIKAFYMKLNDDGKTVAAMDILAPGIGEIVGGAQREDQYDVLIAKMKKLGMEEEQLSWYLDLRRFGTTPHSGFGLGFERLVSYITGVQNIRDVIPFPRASKMANY